MKVMVLGAGGREHALCERISLSPLLDQLYCLPGNPGIARVAQCVEGNPVDCGFVVKKAQEFEIDLVIVGPEAPLSEGVVDALEAAGIPAFGPTKAAAQIEASKTYSKEIMEAANVRTPRAVIVTSKTEALEVLASFGLDESAPVVLKADGLAEGKGVFVCSNVSERIEALEDLYVADSERKVLIEEFIEGHEASLIVCVNDCEVVPLVPAHDYKRIGEGNVGLNTGGMGTLSPTPYLPDELVDSMVEVLIRPVIKEMSRRGTPFRGFLFAGLMINASGEVYVLEFNARSGDPETQVIMSRLRSDILPTLAYLSGVKGFEGHKVSELLWDRRTAICVVHASAGYPKSSSKGDEIRGLKEAIAVPNVQIIHAATMVDDNGTYYTNGGRVLNVIGVGNGLEEARRVAYEASDRIVFNGQQYRRDIGGSNASPIVVSSRYSR
jgi:phosphoribosylamine--glycine ligase